MRNRAPPIQRAIQLNLPTEQRKEIKPMCMTRDEINTTVHDLKELRALQDRIAAKIKALEDQIKQHMSDTDIFFISGDDYSVTWNEVSSTRLDTTAIKRDHPDLAAEYTRTSTTRRFIVN